jgi:anti-sigma-K factor RskA
MTASDAARDPADIGEPGDIEALLPWYAAGTLRRRDRQRVEEALRSDAALARHVELVREELAETIHLNETLGAPPPRVADRLMAAIEAEANAKRKTPPGAAVRWLTGVFANLPPRTLAVAASFAILAIALQAFMLVDIFTRPQGGTQQAALEPAHRHGSFAMVRFAQAASAAEITNFLHNYQAALVDGPTPSGLYRVRIAVTSLAKEEMGKIIAKMRQDRIVELAEPAAEPEPADPAQANQ